MMAFTSVTLLFVAALGAGAPGHDGERFNLACSGRSVTTGQRGRFDKPISTLASVDLTTMRFCWREGACHPFPVRRATPSELVLRDEHTVQGDLTYVVRFPKGAYVSDGRIHLTPPPDVVTHEQGICRKLPFTPF